MAIKKAITPERRREMAEEIVAWFREDLFKKVAEIEQRKGGYNDRTLLVMHKKYKRLELS